MNIKNKNLKERGPASLSDNLRYINDTVSHMEINRFNGVNDKDGYQVVCKAKTINVVTGKKSCLRVSFWILLQMYLVFQLCKNQSNKTNRKKLSFQYKAEFIMIRIGYKEVYYGNLCFVWTFI